MISLAAPQGSVGPHVDSYDVFLLQGRGRRRWRVAERFAEDYRARPRPARPARLPRGAANGCSAPATCCTCRPAWPITASPSRSASPIPSASAPPPNTISWPGSCSASWAPSIDRGSTPIRTSRRAREPGEISPAALARLRRIVASGSRAGTADFVRFAGEHLTEPRVGRAARRPRPLDSAGLARALRLGAALVRRPDARVAFARRGRGALLFADGRHWTLPPALAQAAPVLTRTRRVASESLRPLLRRRGLIALLAELVSARVFEVERRAGTRARAALRGRRGSRRAAGSPRTRARP